LTHYSKLLATKAGHMATIILHKICETRSRLAEALIALRRHIRLIKFSMGLLRGVHVKYFLFVGCGLTDEGGQCYKPPSLI
jgi:hypothetical protein